MAKRRSKKSTPKYDRIHARKPVVSGFKNLDQESGLGGARMAWDYRDATGEGPNAIGVTRLDIERARSRHEFLTNEYASKASELLTSYVVANGIRPHIKDPSLAAYWKKFVKHSDPSGLLDFYGQQALVMRGTIEGGEMLARPRPRKPEDGLPIPLQIQLLEGEYLPTTRSGTMPANTIAGIELDSLERRAAYWLYQRHPGELFHTGNSFPDIRRVPAENVFHIFDVTRSGSLRGSPWASKTLPRMRSVEKYEQADLARKETAALLGVAVKMPSADDSVDGVLGLGSDEREEGQEFSMAPLEPGAIFGLPPGAEIQVVNPQDSSTGFQEAWRTRYLGVAAGLGVPYPLLTGDFTGHNDRTMRVVMIDFFKKIKKHRSMLNQQFNQKVWSVFLLAAWKAGWRPPQGMTFEDFEIVDWIGEPLMHIHPLQEVNAHTNAMRSGEKTLGQVLQEQGTDLETFVAEKKMENALLDEAGIVLDSDPRKITKAGGYQEGVAEKSD